MKKLKLAILDMYDGTPNQGMRAIKEIVSRYESVLDWKVFDVRKHETLPGMEYDIFISSGGPGDPREGDGKWDKAYYDLLDRLWQHNLSGRLEKKYVFFICHSFQMACNHFGMAEITERRTRAFGTFPAHKTKPGREEPLMKALPNPFYVADFRSYQVIQPRRKVFEKMGAQILSLEKKRPHIPLERAIMAIRFSEEMFGTQFHPEADPEGMLIHFSEKSKKEGIIKEHGIEKFERMMSDLENQKRIPLTHDVVIPGFLDDAIEKLNKQKQMQLAMANR